MTETFKAFCKFIVVIVAIVIFVALLLLTWIPAIILFIPTVGWSIYLAHKFLGIMNHNMNNLFRNFGWMD